MKKPDTSPPKKSMYRWLLLLLLIVVGVGLPLWLGHEKKSDTTPSLSASPEQKDVTLPTGATKAIVRFDDLLSKVQCDLTDDKNCETTEKSSTETTSNSQQTTLDKNSAASSSLKCSKDSTDETCVSSKSAQATVRKTTQSNESITSKAPSTAASLPPATKSIAHQSGAFDPTPARSSQIKNSPHSAQEQACLMAPNPTECLWKLTHQQGTTMAFNPANYPLTSDVLGLSGPLSFALRYDPDLALVLGVGYTQMFNEAFGVNGKFTVGANEHRANLTAGFALTTNQQLKLTYEYLAQNLNFDFASGGVQEWVDQHALGAAYQYLIRDAIVHSFEVSGYTIRANSKQLSDLAFNQTGNSYDVNYRHIAGGTENTLFGAVNLLPMDKYCFNARIRL